MDFRSALFSRRSKVYRPAVRMLLGGLLLLGGSSAPQAQELMASVSTADLVEQAEWVGVADLVAAVPRMNARGNLVVTDFSFRQQQTLLGTPPAVTFTLSQGGGTLGGITDHISDAADLEVGKRYLIFVRPHRGEVFPPFVGGAQGAFEMSTDGRAVSLGIAHAATDAAQLIDQVRVLAAARGSAPAREPQLASPPQGLVYPAKTFLPLALTPAPTASASTPAPEVDRIGGPQPAATAAAGSVTRQAIGGQPMRSIQQPDWHYDHRINPPAIINGFPHDWVWHPFEENQLAYWNQYAGEIFRVYTTPTGNWAWGNGVFDLAGFPSNDDMVAQFGEGWGAGALGITYSRWDSNNVTIEADTALNPAQCWTLDDRWGTDDTAACWSFRRTMLHEVGHTWGLRHPWETQAVSWDTVLNYTPHEYRFPTLFLDDTSAARDAFGGLPIHDAAISLYTTSLDTSPGAQSALYTPTQTGNVSIHHGEDLAARMPNQFKIENTGTDDVVSPEIDFYLTPNRMSWDGTTPFIGSGTGSTVPAGWVYTFWLPSLPIASSVPTGDYWLAAYLPAGDAVPANDSAWANQATRVHVDNSPGTLFPGAAWQLSEVGSLGPAGTWSFYLSATGGTTYDLSLCPADGGWASFDTVVTVYDGGTAVASNDDSCDLQSRLTWTASYSGTFTVQVASYQAEYQGSFQLAYIAEVVDPVFHDGFD